MRFRQFVVLTVNGVGARSSPRMPCHRCPDDEHDSTCNHQLHVRFPEGWGVLRPRYKPHCKQPRPPEQPEEPRANEHDGSGFLLLLRRQTGPLQLHRCLSLLPRDGKRRGHQKPCAILGEMDPRHRVGQLEYLPCARRERADAIHPAVIVEVAVGTGQRH